MESASNGLNEAATASYPTIAATATALPPYTITREDVKVYMGRVFDIPERRLEAMMSIVDNAQVHNRHSIFPLDYTIEPRPLSQTNNEYIEHAVKLGREAAEKCLERADLKPSEIDMIITVSCTGFMIPSLDAHLIIAVELPSLTFQRKDISQANLISSILFGDGAAAVVVSGKQMKGPKILKTETYTFPDSLGAMGFDLRDSGFHILLAKDVPEMIGGKIGGLVQGFLDSNGRKREEIKGWILHPGGARLLGNIETELGLCKCDTQPSWDILGNVGNLSSATILFILQEWLEKRPLQAGEYAFAAASLHSVAGCTDVCRLPGGECRALVGHTLAWRALERSSRGFHAPRRGDIWTFSLCPASKLRSGVCGDAGSSADSHGVDHRSGGSYCPRRRSGAAAFHRGARALRECRLSRGHDR